MHSFVLLLVDDERPICEDLGRMLSERLPGSQIDMAHDAHEARRLISARSHGNRPYDAAVLDIMMPPHERSAEVIYTDLDNEFRRRMPSTHRWVITANLNRPTVQQHEDDRRFHPIWKDGTWPEQVVTEILEYLYGLNLRRHIGLLTGGAFDTDLAFARGGALGLNASIAEAERDVAFCWRYFSDETKEFARLYFEVDDSDDIVTVRIQ